MKGDLFFFNDKHDGLKLKIKLTLGWATGTVGITIGLSFFRFKTVRTSAWASLGNLVTSLKNCI